MGLHPQTGHDDDPTATLWQRAVDQQSSRQTYSGGIIVARPTEIYLIKKKENGIHHRSETPQTLPPTSQLEITVNETTRVLFRQPVIFWFFSIPKKKKTFLVPHHSIQIPLQQSTARVAVLVDTHSHFSNSNQQEKLIKMTKKNRDHDKPIAIFRFSSELPFPCFSHSFVKSG
jgi:hypothetical protein